MLWRKIKVGKGDSVLEDRATDGLAGNTTFKPRLEKEEEREHGPHDYPRGKVLED